MNPKPLLPIFENESPEEKAERERHQHLEAVQPGPDDSDFTALKKWLIRNRRPVTLYSMLGAMLFGLNSLNLGPLVAENTVNGIGQYDQAQNADDVVTNLLRDMDLAESRRQLGESRRQLLGDEVPDGRGSSGFSKQSGQADTPEEVLSELGVTRENSEKYLEILKKCWAKHCNGDSDEEFTLPDFKNVAIFARIKGLVARGIARSDATEIMGHWKILPTEIDNALNEVLQELALPTSCLNILARAHYQLGGMYKVAAEELLNIGITHDQMQVITEHYWPKPMIPEVEDFLSQLDPRPEIIEEYFQILKKCSVKHCNRQSDKEFTKSDLRDVAVVEGVEGLVAEGIQPNHAQEIIDGLDCNEKHDAEVDGVLKTLNLKDWKKCSDILARAHYIFRDMSIMHPDDLQDFGFTPKEIQAIKEYNWPVWDGARQEFTHGTL